MKKRVLSLFLAFVLCLTLLPTSVFAEGADGSAAAGAQTEDNGQPANTGEGEQPNSETDTRTEIWCVGKPDSIQRGYDGTTDGSTIPIDLTFTEDGTNNITLKEGTGFTAKKTFDSADAGSHTVTVEIELIGDAAAKYKLKAGEETFTIGGFINKAHPDLNVSLSRTTCTVGEKLLPLLSVSGAPKDAEVTYYYLASEFKSWAGSSDVEGSEAMPEIDENTAISEPGTYYVYAKTGATTNYEEERSTTVKLTVNEAVVEAASVTKADGTDGGTYESLPAALNAAQNGDTVNLLANHTTNWSNVEAGEEQMAVVRTRITLDLNGNTVDYLVVGEVVPDEAGGILESYDGNLTVQSSRSGSTAIAGQITTLRFVQGTLAVQDGVVIGSSSSDTGLICGADSGTVTISGGTVTISGGTVYNAIVGKGAAVTVSGGSMHQGRWTNYGTLNITGGTFGRVKFYNNGGTIAISGGTFGSLQNLDNGSFQIAPISLLAPDHAFYDINENTVKDGSIRGFLQDVTVKEHTHTMVSNKCACGLSCTHTNAEGASTIGKDGKCTACGTQFVAAIGENYYINVKSALDAAQDGDTVKLLANEMLPDGIYVSKTLTLDLNGHSLSGYSLNVGGLTAIGQVRTGKLTVIDSSGGNGAVGVTVRNGGTLVFNPENDNTTLLQLEVYGGIVELYGGKISRSGLRLNNNIKLGNLLPGGAGLAYYRGDTQLTLAEAASQTCDLVVKSCSHGGKNGFDNSSATCPYCNAPAVAETALYNGEGNSLWRRFANLQTAIDADRDGGAEFKLLTDVTGDYTIDGKQNTALDLNGHSIKGTVTVKGIKGDYITTTLSNTQNTTTASIDKVIAFDGAELAGSGYPAVIGELTLAEGATWKTILNDTALGYKVLNADGTHKWYAWDDVNGSQLNNVIINRLPITSKTLNLKVGGKNLTGNSPKVERGTTVQLCASCNAKDANVSIYIGEIVGNNIPKYILKKAEYKKIGTTWYYVVDLDANTIGTYDIYFTASKDGYKVTSSHKTLTVTKPNLSNAEITFPYGNEAAFNYMTATGVPTFVVKYNGTELKENVDFFITRGDSFSGVGPCTLTIKATDNGDYTGSKSAEWTVRPLKVAASVGDIVKTYDGTTALPENTKITFKSADTYYKGAVLPLAKGTDYEVSNAHYDSADASQAEKTISFTVKLKNAGYVFEDGTTQKDFTLNGADLGDKTFKITKAAIASDTQLYQTVFNDLAKTYEIDLNQVLDKILPEGGKYGDIQYGQPSVNMDSAYYPAGGANIGNGKLSLSINKAASSKQGDEIGTVAVQVETTNYQTFTLTIHVSVQDKLVPVLAEGNTVSATDITYGQALADSKLTVNGMMKDPNTGATVNGTFAWTDGTIKPTAGDYEAEWTFTPDSEEYATVTGKTTVKVAPKSIEGAKVTLEADSFVYDGNEKTPVVKSVVLDNVTLTSLTDYGYIVVKKSNVGIYNFTITGAGNYTGEVKATWQITPREVTPTIEVASCTYTGDALEPNVTLKDGNKVIPTDEYTVEYSNNTNAGIGRVTIKDVADGNYVIKEKTQDFTITKAAAPTNIQSGTLTITNGLHKTYSLDLSTLLPKLTAPCAYGTITYDKKVVTNLGVGSFSTLVNGKTGELTLEANRSGTDERQFGTITVTISTSNYQDITLTVNIFAKNKLTPVPDGKITASKITYGQALNNSSITGKMKDPSTGATVNGTFTWTDGTIKPDANDRYEAEWTFNPDSEEYATVTGNTTVKVAPKSIEGAAITLEKSSLEYNAAEQSPKITGVTLENWSENITYRIVSGDTATNVNDSPTLTIEGTGNYTGKAAVKWKITPREVTPTIEVASCTYTGDALEPTVTLKDGNTVIPAGEYTVEYSDNTNAGTGRVTIKDVAGGNYVIKEETQDFTITKAAAPTNIQSGTLTITNGLHKTYSLDLSTLLPKLTAPCDYGTITYDKKVVTNLGVGSFITLVDGKTGELTLEADRSGTDEGKFGTITVTISTSNYQDITLTINIFAKNKLTPVPDGKITATKITYGDTLSKSEISGKMKYPNTGTEVKGTFTWTDGTIKPDANDRYEAEWTFNPDSEEYATVTGTATVEVDKARQYGEISMAGYSYGGTPSTPTLTDRTGDPNAQVLYTYYAADSGLVQTWDIMNPPTLNAGTYHMFARIGATNNYYEYSAEYCVFVVAKATPTYAKPTDLTAKYGQTLEDVTLPDGWSWMDSSESVGSASTAAKTFKAKFTPTDIANYNVAENIELEVTVNKADQAALTIQGADSVLYGQTLTLTASGGSGTGAVTYRIDTVNSTGEATIDPNTGVLTPVKVGSVSVIATKTGGNDYNDVTSAIFVLMVKPATPTGAPKYTELTTGGKTLKDAALTTEGSTLKPTDGKLEWVDDNGNVLPDSTGVKANTTYKWRFTPTNTNYTTLTGEIELYHRSGGSGGSSGGGSSYNYYTIKAAAGAGGSISPSGNVSIREGREQTFTITPDEGYAVSDVKIDGKSIGAVKSYTFEKVSRTHTIEVVFMKASGTPQTGVFVDVVTGSYYEEAVAWAVKNGITQGIDSTHFFPNDICTRAQAVTFLWRAAGSPAPKTRTMPFTDVPEGSYYYDAVLWAVENGITQGTSDTTFDPNATCSRAQIVAFLWRSEKSPASGMTNPFADVKSTDYYADAVLWAFQKDITKGTADTAFSPSADCTRAQIVTFLWRCKK